MPKHKWKIIELYPHVIKARCACGVVKVTVSGGDRWPIAKYRLPDGREIQGRAPKCLRLNEGENA